MKNNHSPPLLRVKDGSTPTHTHTENFGRNWRKKRELMQTWGEYANLMQKPFFFFFLQFDHKLEVCFITVFLYILLQFYISFSLQMLHIQLNTIGGHFACTPSPPSKKRNLNHLNIFLVSRLQTQVIFERQYTVGACAFSSFSYHTSHTALVHYNSYNFS